MKVEPLPGLALDADVAAHHLAEAAADDEAEAGPAVAPRGGGVGLGEGLEEPRLLLGRHADAGVADAEDDLGRARRRSLARDLEGDGARAR